MAHRDPLCWHRLLPRPKAKRADPRRASRGTLSRAALVGSSIPAEPLLRNSKGFRASHPATESLPAREPMPASQHHRQSTTCLRSMPPPRQMTKQDHRDDALLDDRLHQLFGPPVTIHPDGAIDWSWEQYSEAVAQLQVEVVIRPTDEVVN